MMIRVRGWLLYYAYESPLKDVSARMHVRMCMRVCVCCVLCFILLTKRGHFWQVTSWLVHKFKGLLGQDLVKVEGRTGSSQR